MQKQIMATLTPRQVLMAALAGAAGHLVFALGWFTLGLSVLGGVVAGVLGVSTTAIASAFGDLPALSELLSNVQAVVGVLVLVVAIGSVVVIALGLLASGAILSAGRVRSPWKTSFVALGVAALASLPLLFVYGVIARTASVSLALVSIVGSLVVGAAVWVWIAWVRRGPASRFAGVTGASARSSVVSAEEPQPPAG